MPQPTQAAKPLPTSPELGGDSGLIRRVLDGDGDAFGTLITPYLGIFTNGIQRVLRNDLDSQDALQAAMIHIHQGLTEFRADSKFSTWAFRICINDALMLRRTRMRRRENGFLEFPEHHPEWHPNPVAFVPAEEEHFWSILHTGMAKLSFKHKEVFVLRDLQGLTTDEVAHKLGIRSGLVRQRLHRARRELRDTMGVFRAPGRAGLPPGPPSPPVAGGPVRPLLHPRLDSRSARDEPGTDHEQSARPSAEAILAAVCDSGLPHLLD